MEIKEISIEEPAKAYNKKIYIAKDGQEFSWENDCIKHEKKIDADENIKKLPFKICEFDGDSVISEFEVWYYLSNKEDYNILKNYLESHCSSADVDAFQDKFVNDWVTYRFEYHADEADFYELFSFKELKEDFDKLNSILKK